MQRNILDGTQFSMCLLQNYIMKVIRNILASIEAHKNRFRHFLVSEVAQSSKLMSEIRGIPLKARVHRSVYKVRDINFGFAGCSAYFSIINTIFSRILRDFQFSDRNFENLNEKLMSNTKLMSNQKLM